MENFTLDTTISDILTEYDKFILSTLIGKPYDFNILKNKLKEFSQTSDFFEYSDEKTDAELVREIANKIRISNQDK